MKHTFVRRYKLIDGRFQEIPHWPEPSEPNPAWYSPASATKAPGSPWSPVRAALAVLGAIAVAQALVIFYLLEVRCR